MAMISLAAAKLWPWKAIGKISAAVVLAGLLAWGFILLKGWHDDSELLPVAQADRDAAIAETARVRKDLNSEVTRLHTVNQGLLDENQTLRTVRAATPVRSVRLCPQETRTVPSDPAPSSGDDGSLTGIGVLPEERRSDHQERPDIGPDLYTLFDEADDMLRRFRGLQEYVRGLPKACLAPAP
jgi:hypothetical protein